jgi:hypothetical protein
MSEIIRARVSLPVAKSVPTKTKEARGSRCGGFEQLICRICHRYLGIKRNRGSGISVKFTATDRKLQTTLWIPFVLHPTLQCIKKTIRENARILFSSNGYIPPIYLRLWRGWGFAFS